MGMFNVHHTIIWRGITIYCSNCVEMQLELIYENNNKRYIIWLKLTGKISFFIPNMKVGVSALSHDIQNYLKNLVKNNMWPLKIHLKKFQIIKFFSRQTAAH